MKRPNRGCIVFLLAGMLGVTAGTARADDPAPAAAPAAPAPPMAPAEHKFTGDQQSFYVSGGVSQSPFLTVGTTFPSGPTFAIGVNFNYNGNGQQNAMGMTTTDKVAFQGLLYGGYYFYNKFPIGIAAEAAVIAPLAPSDAQFNPITIQPGLAIFYAPFPVPLVLGTGIDLQINLFKDPVKPIVSTVMPGLRIVYVF